MNIDSFNGDLLKKTSTLIGILSFFTYFQVQRLANLFIYLFHYSFSIYKIQKSHANKMCINC